MVFDVWPVYSGERFRAPGPSRFFFFFFFFLGGGGGGGGGGLKFTFSAKMRHVEKSFFRT